MNNADEQAQELEVLRSIYYDELVELGPGEEAPEDDDESPLAKAERAAIDSKSARFRVRLKLDVDGEDDDVPKLLRVRVAYAPEYPEAPPAWLALEDPAGELSAEERAAADAVVSEQLELNAGMPAVFAAVSAVKEHLETETMRVRRQAAHDAYAAQLAALEAEERRKNDGTKVTTESFAAWKATFDAEMLAAGRQLGFDLPVLGGSKFVAADRLSGRQLFERDRSLVTSDLAFRGATAGDAEADVDIDAALFALEVENLALEEAEALYGTSVALQLSD